MSLQAKGDLAKCSPQEVDKLAVSKQYLCSHPLDSQRNQEGIGLRIRGIDLHQNTDSRAAAARQSIVLCCDNDTLDLK